MNEKIKKFLGINLRTDVSFKYLFTRNEKENRNLLKSMLEDYLHRDIDTIMIMSEELKVNGNYGIQQVFDILVQFDDRNKVDIEMQLLNNKDSLESRMSYYIAKLEGSQLESGQDYRESGQVFLLLFLDHLRYEDDLLVHRFTFRTESGLPFEFKKPYQTIITVELPKVKYKMHMTDEEIWAYMLKCSGTGDEDLADSIEKLMESRKEAFMVVECADRISQNDREWLEEFNRQRERLLLNTIRKERQAEVDALIRADIEQEVKEQLMATIRKEVVETIRKEIVEEVSETIRKEVVEEVSETIRKEVAEEIKA